MNKRLTPRIYREYCWFALLLLVLAIGVAWHAKLGDGRAHPAAVSAPAANRPL